MWADRIPNIWFGLSTRYEKEYAKEASPVICITVSKLCLLTPIFTYYLHAKERWRLSMAIPSVEVDAAGSVLELPKWPFWLFKTRRDEGWKWK
jgi:hypothetical protein